MVSLRFFKTIKPLTKSAYTHTLCVYLFSIYLISNISFFLGLTSWFTHVILKNERKYIDIFVRIHNDMDMILITSSFFFSFFLRKKLKSTHCLKHVYLDKWDDFFFFQCFIIFIGITTSNFYQKLIKIIYKV